MSMEVIQLDENSDDEIDKPESPKTIIRIESDDDSVSSHDIEIYVDSDNNDDEVVCLEDTSSDRSEDEDDNVSEEPLAHGSDSRNNCSEATQDLPRYIEKSDDDNAVDFDLFDFEEQTALALGSPDNLNEDFNTFEDFKSETVDELREIITSDEDDTRFGDVLSQQLVASPLQDIFHDLDFKLFGGQLFLSVESLKLLFHSKEDNFLDDLIAAIEREGLAVSDCLRFTGWQIKHLSLAAVKLIQENLILVARKEEFKQFLHQIQPANCHVDVSSESPVVEQTEEPQPVEVDAEVETETIEVSQNREMKRKGIKLPRGWRVLGKKTETELECQGGEQHRFIKIDWKFKSPEGIVYDDLKTALAIVKKTSRKYEKWEILVDKQVKILEAAPAYVTLKQQLDAELDQALERDVFSLSGIRPVRKFPDNHLQVSKSRPLTKVRSEVPIRISAQLKSNPISVAQREKMERKSGAPIERFKLTEVSQVKSNLHSDGWFSSKLLAMKLVSRGVSGGGFSLTSEHTPKLCPSKPSGTNKKVHVKVHQDTKDNLILDLDRLAKSPVMVDPLCSPSPSLKPLTPHKMPNFQRSLVMRHDLPSNWIIKRDHGPTQFISPAGEVFDNIESVVERTRSQGNNNINTPKKRKDSNLPQNSSVIRKLPCLSPAKKARLEEDDIVNLLLDSDSES